MLNEIMHDNLHSLHAKISSVDRSSNYYFQYQTFCPFYYEAYSVLKWQACREKVKR